PNSQAYWGLQAMQSYPLIPSTGSPSSIAQQNSYSGIREPRCLGNPLISSFQKDSVRPTKGTSSALHRVPISLAAWGSGKKWLDDAEVERSSPLRPRYPSST